MPAPARFRAPAEVATRDRTVLRDVRASPLPTATATQAVTDPVVKPPVPPASNAVVAAALRTDTGPKLLLDRLRPVAQNMIGISAVAAARGAAPPAVEEKRAQQKTTGQKQARGPRPRPSGEPLVDL
jgi:hypothetical protein